MSPSRSNRCNRIVVLDNGLTKIGDHSFAISNGLRHEFMKFDAVRLDIFSARDLTKGLDITLDVTPHFNHEMYYDVPASKLEILMRKITAGFNRTLPDLSPSERRTSKTLNTAFFEDLNRLPSYVWASGTLVLIPGLFQHQTYGLAKFIKTNSPKIQAKIVCQLMFETGWLPWQKPSRLGPKTYRRAFKMVRPLIGSTIFFTTENAFIAQFYRRDFGLDTRILPVPLQGKKSSGWMGRIRLGYFGYAKLEKGFDLLPAAIAQCTASRDDLDFVVQIQYEGYEPRTMAAEKELKRMGKIRLLEGALPEKVFAAEASSVDVVLLPYHPILFGLRGSGIFVEAVSAGRLVVASRQIWAGRSIAAGEVVGETFEPHSSQALAEAILRLCEDFGWKRQLAFDRAPSFAAVYSIPNYIKSVFSIAGMQHPADDAL